MTFEVDLHVPGIKNKLLKQTMPSVFNDTANCKLIPIAPTFARIAMGVSLLLFGMLTNVTAEAADPRDGWIQFPPRAAVKFTEQLQKFNEIEADKKEASTKGLNIKESTSKEPLTKDNSNPDKKTAESKKDQSTKQEKKLDPEEKGSELVKAHEKKIVSQDETWNKDHKTRTTTFKFDDGSTEAKVDVIEPISGEPTYKGDIESIPMSYADGVKSIITRKAINVEQVWAKDHSTRTTVYKFSDGTTNVEIKNIPKKYSQPEFKNGMEYITITYGDGTQKIQENEAVDRKTVWSKDHLVQTIIYYFEDGKSYEEKQEVPKVMGTPAYKDDREIIKVTYGDGFVEELVELAIDKKINWASDHLSKTTTYLFPDGTTNSSSATLEKEEISKVYKGNLQTFTYLYPDGTKTALSRKAISEKVTWADDHVTKTVEYFFADGSINKVISEVRPVMSKPIYKQNFQLINYKFGDGTTSAVVNKAISEETSLSESRLYRVVFYKFADVSVSSEEFMEPQVVDNKEKLTQPEKVSKTKTEKENDNPEAGQRKKDNQSEKIAKSKLDQNSDIEPRTKKQEEFIFKNILNKFLDKGNEGETISDHKLSSSAANQPVYLQGLEIVSKQTSDGKTITQTFKAIDKEETWSSDKTKKYTIYKFADGTINKVVTDVNSQTSKVPVTLSINTDEELTRRSLLDE